MLRKLYSSVTRLLNKPAPLPVARVYPRDQHPISRKDISRGALDVLYGLHKAGYRALLVGGCLRDLLAGVKPKDFDVVTDAPPDEIRKLFRRSRIIGRRFQIVHVYAGNEVIEVSTFRAADTEDQKTSAHGMVLRDNDYGTFEEDAIRRDFTINALYYDIADFTLHDFSSSLDDIKHQRIRIIGDPETRYREDPVRMLRAARFQAKMGYRIEPATRQPILRLAPMLGHIPPARLFDEILKVFLTGHAQASLAALQELTLFEMLFPQTANALTRTDSQHFQSLLELACRNTDLRIQQGRPVTPTFLFAVLLWPPFKQQLQKLLDKGVPLYPAIQKAAHQVTLEQCERTTIPKRFSLPMREIWEMQWRLERRQGRFAEQLVAAPRFRAGYDFLLLREESGEITPGLGEWWTRYQEADPEQREQLQRQLPSGQSKPKKRRRRKPRVTPS